jgi:c-di-AMP phosphodiesterase-like protein
MALYFVVLLLFSGAALLLKLYYLAAAEAGITVVLYIYFRISSHRRRRDVIQYIQNTTDSIDSASKDSPMSIPMPMAVLKMDDFEIIWANDLFLQMTGGRERLFALHFADVFPNFSIGWLAEGKTEAPADMEVAGRRYRVYGNLVHGSNGVLPLATMYWVDVTELLNARDEFYASRPVVCTILVDNYDELTNNLTDNNISTLDAALNAKITEWAGDVGGILRKVERNRYLFLFENRYLPQFVDGKFALLDTIREVTNPAGVPATATLGIGKDGDSLLENYNFAALSVEMSLSRGGDQAVIKDKVNFSFFGGRAKETERRTKVKSRVVASSLSELIAQSSYIFVMGHKNADIDALGAAVGIQCICRKKGKQAHIVIDLENNAAGSLLEKLRVQQEYADCFLSPQDAMLLADPQSLLVVVDTNRPDQVESKPLLESMLRVAVIDHHRRAADYIENVTLNFHEPFASSASELVTELLQYAVDTQDILLYEAEALLAGIVLDTKNFSVRTGGRTFEAAAFLRRCGADTVDVKKLFQNDLEHTVARYRIIQAARMYRGEIAIAALDYTSNRTTAAQAADELLNISGILTSFVLYPDGDRVIISARSIGDANVQMILEPLGGGGNAATAGAQVPRDLKTVLRELVASIDRYYQA